MSWLNSNLQFICEEESAWTTIWRNLFPEKLLPENVVSFAARYGFDYVNAFYAGNLRELYNDSLNVHNVEWKNKAALKFLGSIMLCLSYNGIFLCLPTFK